MKFATAITVSWESFWTLRKRHAGPGWARLLIACGMALLVWIVLCLLSLTGVIGIEVRDPHLRVGLLSGILALLQAIAISMLALARLIEVLLSDATLKSLSPARDWRSAALLSLTLMIGALGGNVLGSALLGTLLPGIEFFRLSGLWHQLHFLQYLSFLALLNGFIWRLRLRQHALKAQAAEAELRVLQAQVEPHFLFNTLATIESLLESDPQRARNMLEAFSDHLRSSLTQLRTPETSVATELGMVSNYLRLLKIRMGERLTFSIEAEVEAQAARIPTLLLQPLVENAIRHGLEPKLDGGHVHISASVQQGWLRIRIDDNGLGLKPSRGALRPGAGVALANIRSRLQNKYGARAMLSLNDAQPGVSTSLDLPYIIES